MKPKADTTLFDHQGDHLGGLVERVTFHSEDSGYCVLRVKVKGRRDPATVVGTLFSVSPGEWIDARGAWHIDPRFGQQFRAEELRATPPSTVAGMRKYLGSGLIKGIGPGLAERLIDAFGDQVFAVIEEQPERLTEAEGIGRGRSEKIVSAWAEQKRIRDIMVFLHSHGVGTGRAFRIFKEYGDRSIDLIREDPFRLARDIWGIGFKSSDRIAASLGIAPDSPLRARAGVEHTLQQLTDRGHCAYPREQLAAAAAELLEIPAVIAETALDEAIASGRLAQHELVEHELDQRGIGATGPPPPGMSPEDPASGPLIYLSPLDRSERELARNLIALNETPHPCPGIDAPRALDWVEQRIGLSLAPEQREAVRLATVAKTMVITGGPGVGKTTLVNAILTIFRAKRMRVVLCAPTGRAAKRLGETSGSEAKTIHRLLAFDPRRGRFRHDRDNPLDGDIFVIDEFSMVDLVLAHQLIRAIPPHAAVIIVGDVDQLPSVGPGCVLRDVIDSGALPVVRLETVFRQAARSAIITNAHRVNRGLFPELDPAAEPGGAMSDFYFVSCEEPEPAVDVILRLVCERIPARLNLDPRRDIQVLTPMRRGQLGVQNLNQRLQAALNPGEGGVVRSGWTFRPGDKVMQLVNNYDKDVFNGDIGIISTIGELREQDRDLQKRELQKRELIVRFDERLISYDLRELDELALAYAISIHKSQGSEFPAVVVPLHTQHYVMLQRNLLYTAITRARRLVVLVGSKRALAIAVKRVESQQRITTLRQRLQRAARADREG